MNERQLPPHVTSIVVMFDLNTGDASNESDNGGEDRGEEAVAETSEERGQASDEAGEEATQETDEDGQDVGDESEDGVEERDKLGAETEDGDNRVDGGEEQVNEYVDEDEDTVNITLGNGDTSSTSEGGDNLSDVDLDALNEVNDLGISLRLLDLAGLELGEDIVDERRAGLDLVNDAGDDGDNAINVLDLVLGVADLVDGTRDGELGDDLSENIADGELLQESLGVDLVEDGADNGDGGGDVGDSVKHTPDEGSGHGQRGVREDTGGLHLELLKGIWLEKRVENVNYARKE